MKPPDHKENTVEEKKQLLAALVKVKGTLAPVKKGKKNLHFKSSYAGLDDLYGAIQEPLSENGLAIVHQPEYDPSSESWVLRTRLYHESGEYLDAVLPIAATHKEQDLGSALTYMRRYNIGCLLSLAETTDDDGTKAHAASQAQPRPVKKKAKSRGHVETNMTETKTDAPANNSLKQIWPAVYRAADLMSKDRQEGEAWFRNRLKEWVGEESTKALDQQQANDVLRRLQDVIAKNTPPEAN